MQDSAHSCCTGSCDPVTLRHDCFRLLKADSDDLNVARLCPQLGTCSFWPGQNPPGPGSQSTPWAVMPQDLAAKYYKMKDLTFAKNTQVRVDTFIRRRVGQSYDGIDPSTTYPGSINDAGRIHFVKDAKVDTSLWGRFRDGIVDYCVAPITLNGVGGGYYAVGKGCCTSDRGFYCIPEKTDVSGLVIATETEKYASARQSLELQEGTKFHGNGKGIETLVPLYVRIVPDLDAEVKAESIDFTYVVGLKTSYCVAPVGLDMDPKAEINFWAVGENCCEKEFACGAVTTPGAHSGTIDPDLLSEYRKAVAMADMKYQLKAPKRPVFVIWKDGILVPPPN